MINKISELWCRKMHTKAMWPIHGRYICPQCLRTHAVVWEDPVVRTNTVQPAVTQPEMQPRTAPLYQ
jgi:hypothetical protein